MHGLVSLQKIVSCSASAHKKKLYLFSLLLLARLSTMISLIICPLVPFLPGISDQFIFDDVPAILENKVSAVIVRRVVDPDPHGSALV
jgi:hypothetical protein